MEQEESKYKAGICNIGEAEIDKRKRLLFISSFFTLAFSVFYFFSHHSAILMAVFISAIVVFIVAIEISQRFCILFGIFNLYNFGKRGDLHKVNYKEDIKKDRMKVIKIIAFSLLFSAVYVLIIFFSA